MKSSDEAGASDSWRTRPAMHAGLVAFVVGTIAQLWAHRTGVVFAFWDAQAHLDIARRVVDSTTPGLQMLGTVWLPVPHLLMLPFTLVDRWWWNGLAGGAVGLLSLVVIIASLHSLLMRRVGRARLVWIATAFVLFNPSLLYLQTTAMTEPLLLAFLVASVNLLDIWNLSGSRKALVAAGIMAALAVGSRYDGWFYVLCATPAVALLADRHHRGWATPAAKVWWRDMVIFAAPSAVMVAAWLAFNAVYFGDALAFQRGVWSAQSQAAALAGQQAVPTAHHLLLSIWYYGGAAMLCVGLPLLVVGLGAVPVLFRHLRTQGTALLLLTALPFNILALWAQQSVIQLPWGSPAGILNVRYGVMMLPGLAAMLALAVSRVLRRYPQLHRGMFVALLLLVAAQAAFFAAGWPDHAGALREGLAIRDGDRRQQLASDWFAAHYDGGRILVDEGVNISPRSRIALRDRIYKWTWQLGTAALAAPETQVDWVMVDAHHRDGVVERAIAGRQQFTDRFDRAFNNDGLEIWRRR